MTTYSFDLARNRAERLREFVSKCPDWWKRRQLELDIDALLDEVVRLERDLATTRP